MKNSKYWQNRFKQLEAAQHATSAAEYAEVQKQFDKAYAAIQAKINAWYGRYADNNGISIEEARKQLSKAELKELKWDVREYIKYGKENAIDGRWMKELENASAKAHISRLEAIQLQTQQECEKLMGGVTDDIDEHLKRQYKNDYYHTAYEIQKGTGVGYSLAELNDDKLDNIIKKPWAADGKNFATRMGESKTTLINNIHNSLTQMCLLGENPQKAINQLAATMNGDKKRAGNIIMTESAFFSSEAQKQCFNDLDVEEFEIVATLDSHTDDECQKRDGVHKPMKFFEAGVTAPPFHPRCRCCTIPYFEDLGGERIARDEEGNSYYVPADTTYEQWKNGFVGSKKPTEFEPIKKDVKIDVPIEDRKNTNELATEHVQDAIKDAYEYKRTEMGVSRIEYDEADMNKKISLDGMGDKLAETTANRFADLASKYTTTCEGISVKKFDAMLGSVPAATDIQLHTVDSRIEFNKALVKDDAKFYERMKTAVERGQFPDMDESMYYDYVVTHEFAHTLMDFESPLKNYVNADLNYIKQARKEITAIHKEYKDNLQSLILKQRQAEMKALETFDEFAWEEASKLSEEIKKATISKYADMSIDEFYAEAFTDATIGRNPSQYSNRVKDVVDKYFTKKPIKKPIKEYKKGKVDVLEDFNSKAKPKSGSIIYDKSFTYEGVTYDVDGINVKQHNNPHEIAVGEMLHNKFGGNIEFVPEVNGKYNYVKTPDYIWNDEKWDLKELNGKSSDAIRNAIKSKEKQSHNFIIDITNYQNDIDDVLKQCEIVFNASNTKFVEHLMIIKDMKVLHIFKRVQ